MPVPGLRGAPPQGHHLHHWANGGPTRLDNLAQLCRRHHGAVHEEGYQVARDADGMLRFRTPGGRPIPEVPAPPAVPPDPTQALVAAHRVEGLAIHARTGCPSWLGERLDLGWAIDVLHPAANPLESRLAGKARSDYPGDGHRRGSDGSRSFRRDAARPVATRHRPGPA